MGGRGTGDAEAAVDAGQHGSAPSLKLHERLAGAKRAFVTRTIDLAAGASLALDMAPQAGDVLLARVLDVGAIAKLESPEGRRVHLYPGDEILVVYGNRYAAEELEAVVPERASRCELVAAGGIAGHVVSAHGAGRQKTHIEPIGILCDRAGAALNLSGFALKAPRAAAETNIIAVIGASAAAGAHAVAVNLVRGLSESGARVGVCRITGVGSSDGLFAMRDAGAVCALDFTDLGYGATYGLDAEALERAAGDMLNAVQAHEVDVVVATFADGLLQRETALLLSAASRVARRIDAVFLAAADAMGAVAAAQWAKNQKLPLRAISGSVTASPLAAREAGAESGCEVVAPRAFAKADTAVRFGFGEAANPMPRSSAARSGRAAYVEAPGEPTRSFCLFRPKTELPGAPLVVSVHGISRGVSANMFRFVAEANRYGVCILAPLFTQEKYGQYQQLVDRRTGVRSDLALLDMIDAAASLTKADTRRLLMFGYSGGAQFAQRFTLAHPEMVASVSLAAAGWYTMPDACTRYPYGLDEAPVAFKLDAALMKPQHVFVGDADVARDASLRRTGDLDSTQGQTRLERATTYVNAMRAAAEARGGRAPSLELLADVGHDFVESVEQADLARRVFAHFAADAGLTPTISTPTKSF